MTQVNTAGSSVATWFHQTAKPALHNLGAQLSQGLSKVAEFVKSYFAVISKNMGPWLCQARQAFVSLINTARALPPHVQIAAGASMGIIALVGILFGKYCCAQQQTA